MTYGGAQPQWHQGQSPMWSAPAPSKMPVTLGIVAIVWVLYDVLLGPGGPPVAFFAKIAVDLLVLLGAVLALNYKHLGAILVAIGAGISLVSYGVSLAAPGAWLAFPGNPGIAWRSYLLAVFTLVLLILAAGPANKALAKLKGPRGYGPPPRR